MSSGVFRTASPNAIRSRSNGLASFRTFFTCRPNAFSMPCSCRSNVSGVSFSFGASATAAFTNGGEPGGQSTGKVCQSDDFRIGAAESRCSSSNASRMSWTDLPRLDPSATRATVSCFTTSPLLVYFKPSTSCMLYSPGFCRTTHWAARNAPFANVSRLDALCVSSTRSPFAAKITV
jgi:hypothetical protein